MLGRLRHGFAKYGWRAPLFACVAAVEPLRTLAQQQSRRAKLVLFAQGSIHHSVRIEESVFVSPRARIALAEGVFIGRRATFEISNDSAACLSIGERTWVSHDCHIACNTQVTIGRSVLIGEFTSIRDTSHVHADLAVPIREQGDKSGPITIEDGAWIGRGVLILGREGGLVVGRDSIVAANSVVTCDIPPRTVWGGAPAKQIRARS